MDFLRSIILYVSLVLAHGVAISQEGLLLPEAIEIEKFEITQSSTNELWLITEIRALIDLKADIVLRFPKHIKPEANDKHITFSKKLKTNKTFTHKVKLKISEAGYSLVSVSINLIVPTNYQVHYSSTLRIIHGDDPTDFEVEEYYSDQRVDSVYIQSLSHEDRLIVESDSGKSSINALPKSMISVNVNGNVLHWFNRSVNDPGKGVYGARLELFFRDSSNPNQLYQVLPNSNILHVNYDEADLEGHFHFNFYASGEDFASFDQVVVLVNRSNGAVHIDDGLIWAPESTYFGFEQALILPFNGISISDSGTIELVKEEGAVLRNMFISKKYINSIYNTLDMPLITVVMKYIEDAGRFNYKKSCDFLLFGCEERRHIIIDPQYANLSTSSHEYGHYVNYQLFGSTAQSMLQTSSQVKEGFAIFYSFAVRNYESMTFGGNYPVSNNTEEGSFKEPQYGGFGYTKKGHPEYGAFASLLWNLYDQYNGGIYEADLYAGDNDDVSYQPTRIFDIMKSMCGKSPAQFISMYKSGIPAGIQQSAQDIYNFTLVDENHKMRPAQVKNVTYNKLSNSQIKFNLTHQSYDPSLDYSNTASGIRIYREVNNAWVKIATLSPNTSSYTYTNNSGINHDYKFTTYNSSGESYGPKYINLGLNVSISGPTSISEGQSGNWSVNSSGGEGGYTYKWFRTTDGEVNKLVSTNKSYSSAMPHSYNYMELRAEVTSGSHTMTKTIYVYCYNCSTGCTDPMYTNIILSPNPSSSDLSITLNSEIDCMPELLSEGYFELDFVDEASGQLVEKEKFNKKHYQSKSFKKLKKGNYIVRFRHANGLVEKHVVKQ